MQAANTSTPISASDTTNSVSASSSGQSARASNQSGEKFAAALRNTSSNSLETKDKPSQPEVQEDTSPTPKTDKSADSNSASSTVGSESDQRSVDVQAADKPDKSSQAAGDEVQASGKEMPSWLPEWLVVAGVVSGSANQPQPVTSCDTGADAMANTAPSAMAATNPLPAGVIADTANTNPIAGGKAGATVNAATQTTAAVPTDKSTMQDAASVVSLDTQSARHESLGGNENAPTPSPATLLGGDRPVDTQAALNSRPDLSLANNAISAAGSLVTQHSSPVTTNAPPTPVAASLSMPMNDPRWQESFANQITWQVRDGIQHVNLALNPAELGPVEVRLSVSDGQVSAQFHTAHQSVRQVIEDAMPKLRDMLSQSGLNLANADVFQQSAGRDQRPGNIDTPWSGTTENASEETEAVNTVRSATVVHQGLIDAYV
ncbi:MAG: flagellar hook-length control protein FliK [Gammaproteobacteria bacterium]